MYELLSTNAKVYVAACGAGIGLIRDLWATPGASAYFVGATVPYAKEETDRFLGFTPEQYVSDDTGRDLAVSAFLRASLQGPYPIGIGITASIASKQPHRGEHRAFIWVMRREYPELTKTSTTFTKRIGRIERVLNDEDISCEAGDLLRNALHLEMWDKEQEERLNQPGPVQSTRSRILERPVFCADGRREKDIDPKKTALFPGAFNPLHVGHKAMAAAVERATGRRVVLELSTTTPHKEAVSAAELLYRVAHINAAGHDAIITEGLPLYIDKARRWPGVHFCIGADAALRMLDPKWGPEVEPMLVDFAMLETRFLVFERGESTLEQIWGSGIYRSIFYKMNGAWPVSSSELRAANAT